MESGNVLEVVGFRVILLELFFSSTVNYIHLDSIKISLLDEIGYWIVYTI